MVTKMDCQSAHVVEISHWMPEYGRYYASRRQLCALAQEPVYVQFMGREVYDLFQSGSAEVGPSWDEGDNAHFFNAYVDDALVGVADLMTQPDNWRLVEPMNVLPSCWRQGVGTKLWNACRVAALRDQARGLRVIALRQNEMATRFYAQSLRLPEVGTETLAVGEHTFPAVRYEIAFT